MDHRAAMEGYDLAALARQVGRLRYDALAMFLRTLANELESQSVNDATRRRAR
jgi:hypothetical protein